MAAMATTKQTKETKKGDKFDDTSQNLQNKSKKQGNWQSKHVYIEYLLGFLIRSMTLLVHLGSFTNGTNSIQKIFVPISFEVRC